MLDQNRQWLKTSNPKLLHAYKPQEQKDPLPDLGGLRCLEISHESKKPNLPDDYYSPIVYHEQQSLVKSIQDKPHQGEVRFCLISGTDGGHLLKRTLEENDIKNLVVVEPNIHSFFHSLQTIDWPQIFKEFEDKEGTIYFHIGPVTLEIKDKLTKHVLEIGTFNASSIHMVHDGGEANQEAIPAVIQALQSAIQTLGFYDDERVGLAHSLFKMEQGSRFLIKRSEPWIEKPVVVCGNGPSLTEVLPQIKKNRKDIFLMACGTAVGTLQRHNVKPDFYIEQERPKVTSNWTKRTTTPEFRKGITCIGLNVVHPQTHEMWGDIGYVLKQNDFGGVMVKNFMPECPRLPFVNPLVANAGASIAVALGFRHIWLAGVDCSFSAEGESHAKGSTRKDDRIKLIECAGNFRESVESTPLYQDSIQAMEGLIRLNSAKFFNLGDGALIQGAKPARVLKVKKGKKQTSKTEVMANFKPCEVVPDKNLIRRNFTALAFQLRTLIDNIPDKIRNKTEAFFFIDRIHRKILQMKSEDPDLWYLVKGSFTTQLVFMAACANRDLDAFNESSAILKRFVKHIHEEIRDDLYRFDTWEFGPFGEAGMPEDINAS